MSDQPTSSGAGTGDQLFKNMDEQERIYAPQQLPGEESPEQRGGRLADGAAEDVPYGTPIALPVGSSNTGLPIPAPEAPERLREAPAEDQADADAERH